ncbi:dihydroorotase [Paenibacillus paeoniae]|uniref:Amidohydrolase-related domain-containing protein n=1 Tax=Paenibacillus paeoniae TaxID=2292705 RepID=A0A371PIR3_9BACL|nr:amidohydrolase family protein [Paenibacillus paeoniae]REK76034.1 hypothetical protein DX130_02925 [Paenibacillus paeoniae]
MTEQRYDLAVIGHIVLPDRIAHDGCLGIKDGLIAAIGESSTIAAQANKVVNVQGNYVMPGAIDAHVHCYSSLDEGFTKATSAAAAGGVTTIIEMPYDATGMICTLDAFEEKRDRLEREAVVDVAMLVTIQKQDGYEAAIGQLAEAGACGFKVSMFNTDSFRFPRIDDGQLLDAFAVIAQTGCPVGVHAENDEIVRRYIGKYASRGQDPLSHAHSRPKVSESTAALTVMELAYETGAKLHLYHCTYPRIFRLAETFREMGASVTAETCTHYLTLSEDDMVRLHGRAKINPPLRSTEDVEGLWRLAAEGRIDMITSDHAPWLIGRKSHPDIFQNASGAPGVEQLLPVVYSEGVAKGRLSMLELVRLLCQRPADIFGLGHRKGRIEPGYDADLAIIDPAASWVLDGSKGQSSAGWSPYDGMAMRGLVTHTFVRGESVYEHGSVIGQPGGGSYIKAMHRK